MGVTSELNPMSPRAYGDMIYRSPRLSYFVAGPEHFAMQAALRHGLEAGAAMDWATTYFHAVVLVSADGEIIGRGSVAEAHAELGGCERVRLGSKPGEDYDKCAGCQAVNHSEPRAIQGAIDTGNEAKLSGSTAFLAGHFWCCEPCSDSMEAAGVANVVLLEGAAALFDKARNGAVLDAQNPVALREWFESQLVSESA